MSASTGYRHAYIPACSSFRGSLPCPTHPLCQRPHHRNAHPENRAEGACKRRLPTVIVIGGQRHRPRGSRNGRRQSLYGVRPASIHAEERTVLPAKQDIDADLEDTLCLLDIDWKPEGVSEAGYWSADEVI